ncbi:hypothetical protein P7C70_g3530, partial [Phenoliferia sp. Uapishka_3]
MNQDRGLRFTWNSRSDRKGIHAVPIVVDKADEEKGVGTVETREGQWTVKRRRVRFIGFDWWDISWWVAGSIFWCINAILFFVFFTRVSPGYTNTESATGFLGGTLFLLGAYFGWVESMNPVRDADFGWEIDQAAKTLTERENGYIAPGEHHHHVGEHQPSTRPTAPTEVEKSPASGVVRAVTSSSSPLDSTATKWKWYGTYPSLAYVANSVQLFGASVFWVSTLCGLPGVLPASGSSGGPLQSKASEGLWAGLYWGLQVLGSPCFVFIGVCCCIEVQDKWWKPKPWNVGWQIGFWNTIGGFGFWFCGIFGIFRQTSISNPELYQRWGCAFSTFWASWAFLIGSYIQLWESLNKRQ